MMARFGDMVRGRRTRARVEEKAPALLAVPEPSPESRWFWDHYDGAASQVVDAFQHEALSLTDKVVADIGCGDGFIDLGVVHKAHPQRLVGFDVNLTNIEYLKQRAHSEGIDVADINGLEFTQSMPTRIPADDGVFDLAFSWSAFEHIPKPVEVLTEIKRILSPGGAFFLQLWPFYLSSKGSHLWEWFPEDHHHLQRAECEIVRDLEVSDVKPRDWTNMMSREFQHLNRVTVEELQRSMLAAGFAVRRVEFITGATRLTPELGRYSWLDLCIGGVKLIATPI